MVGVKKEVEYPVLTIPKYISVLEAYNQSCQDCTSACLPKIDLHIRECTFGSLSVKMVHSRFALIGGKTTNQESAFLLAQEFGSFWPVRDDKLGHNGEDNGSKSLDDENPSPTVVASNSGHICDCIGKQLHFV